MNDPSCNATWNSASQTYSDYSFGGYDDIYLNRVRGSIGVDWKVDKRNAFDFFLLGDYCNDKEIDTNRYGSESWQENGLVLKSLTYQTGTNLTFGVAYRFAF